MIKKVIESLDTLHTHTSSLLVNNNRININKKIVIKAYKK